MIVHEVEQRTEEWFKLRLGKVTASRLNDVMAKLKSGGESAGRRNYRAQLVIERLTGRTPDRFQNSAMQWGQETEDLARLTYSMRTKNMVQVPGFYQHDGLMLGASPDGMIGEDGVLEIKCMNSANHIEVLKQGKAPAEYITQIQGQLWVTERKWCDFVSFDPDMKENAQIFIQRIPRVDDYISVLEAEVGRFLAEVDAEMEFLEGYNAA